VQAEDFRDSTALSVVTFGRQRDVKRVMFTACETRSEDRLLGPTIQVSFIII